MTASTIGDAITIRLETAAGMSGRVVRSAPFAELG